MSDYPHALIWCSDQRHVRVLEHVKLGVSRDHLSPKIAGVLLRTGELDGELEESNRFGLVASLLKNHGDPFVIAIFSISLGVIGVDDGQYVGQRSLILGREDCSGACYRRQRCDD